MAGRSDDALFRYTKETYDGSFTADLLEQYKLYVQSAENVSARRVASSRYLLTLNVALCRPLRLSVLEPRSGLVERHSFRSSAFPVSFLWHRIIKSHKDLNDVKFRIVHEIEQRLPAAVYAHEWRLGQ